MRRRRAALPALLLGPLLAIGLCISVASAQPSASDVQDTLDDAQQTVQDTVGVVKDAAPDQPSAGREALNKIGDAFGAVGAFLAAAADAIVAGLGSAARLTGSVATVAAAALAGISKAIATSLSNLGSAFLAALPIIGGMLAAAARTIGGALLSAASAVGSALGAAASAIGATLAAVAQAAWALVQKLRPANMDPVVFNAIAASGTVVSASVGGMSLLAWLRKYGLLGAGLGGIAGFSRIADDKLLENPVRAQVFRTIQSNPGIHPSELARLVGSGWGTIVHHLQKLEKGGLVTTRKVNNQRCYFEQGGKVTRTDMETASAVRGDTASQIAAYVAAHPMTNQKSVAQTMQMSPALVSFHVRKLVNLGALDRVRRGKEVLLATSASLRRVMGGESAAPIPAMPTVAGMA